MRVFAMCVLTAALAAVVAVWHPLKSEDKPERVAKLKQRDAVVKKATDAAEAGQAKDASAAAKAALAFDTELFGADSVVVLDRGFWASTVGELASAVEKHGKDDWRARQPRVVVAYADQLARLAADDRKAIDKMEQLSADADNLTEEGHFAEATAKLTAALDICKRLLGENHTRYADLLVDQGWIYFQARALSKSVPLLEQAVKIRGAVYGESHPTYAAGLNPLAIVYRNLGRHDDARKLYERAEEVVRLTIGKNTRNYISILGNVTNVYSDLEMYDKAEAVAAEAIELERKLKPIVPGDLAVRLNNLAMVYREIKKHDKAEPLFLEAVELNKKGLRANHPDYAHSVHNLAANYYDKGEHAKAAPLFREALAVILSHMEASAAIQSEADQLAGSSRLRFYLNSMLFASEKDDPNLVYDQLYRARGAITLRQMLGRTAATGDSEIQKLLAQLRDTSRRMSGLIGERATDPKSATEYAKLAAEREKIEARLAEQSAGFRAVRLQKLGKLADLQAALPADTVLVDYVQHHDKLAAFVVTKQAVARVSLGDINAIGKAVEQMRENLDRGKYAAGEGNPADALRKGVWNPLLPHITGAKHVLICPDGPLCRLPFAVLPGAKGKTYLIEDVALSVVPVPQLLPELLKAPVPENRAPASFLAVGGVNFDTAPAGMEPAKGEPGPRTRAGGALQWKLLPGTKKEIEEVAKFALKSAPKGTRTVLTGDTATEAAVREQLPKHAHVHFATHGFFVAPEVAPKPLVPLRRLGDVFRDPMTEHRTHPGLTTGVVLAGANKPRPDNDGVLTALEVGDLDLSRVELVVLSACETGLGTTAGGEGALGLQRAFQVAGARTTLTTLWQIPDHATQVLMTHFYENLWVKKMSRVEALRAAQLWMLKEGRADPDLARGLKSVDVILADDGRLPPYYWAAFVLSGDWR